MRDYFIMKSLFWFAVVLCSFIPSIPTSVYGVNIALHVKETLGIGRTGELVHNGIPISRDDNLQTTENLVIESNNGTAIPATFEVLSRWAGGKDDVTKKIKWLLVSFPASLNANESKVFYLKDGTPSIPSPQITLTETSESLTVNTGPAEFVINKTELSLFKEISQNNTVIFSGNTGSTGSFAQIDGQEDASANPPSKITIERQSSQYLAIKLEGTYANSPVGTSFAQPISYRIRHEFFAGSPTAQIYHKFYWAGTNGSYYEGGPITVNKVSLHLPSLNDYSSTEVYANSSTFFQGSLSASQSAHIHQKRRSLFTSPHIAEVRHGAQTTTTEFASRPVLINHTANGAIAVSLDHMHYFEPQSIATDDTGKITINVMAEPQFFAAHQGTWARIAVSALPDASNYESASALTFACLNKRLIAFPSHQYVASSKAFLETPLPPQESAPQSLKNYYTYLTDTTEISRAFLEGNDSYFSGSSKLKEHPFQGLMTWGAMVRYSEPSYVEVDSSIDTWDRIYSGGTLTDYHNAWSNIVFQFLLEADPDILYDFSFMGARRTLHTQIYQPDSYDSPQSTYMGWAPAGYNQYRSDFNSSHSYFENLFNYYYLTGDMEVIDILRVGANSTKKWYTRAPGDDWKYQELNDQVSGGASWVGYTDRVAMQNAAIYNFLGHTYDENFLDDFRHIFNHAFSRSLALLTRGEGKEYAFFTTDKSVESGFQTTQYWMHSLYFMNYLYTLYDEFGDLSLGVYDLPISRIFESTANTYMDYVSSDTYRTTSIVSGSSPPADGTWAGTWNNFDLVHFSGDKIGGTITSVEDYNGSSDPILWRTGKVQVISQILRAGLMSTNQDLTDFGMLGIDWFADGLTVADSPWNKVTGLIFARLHHAMAYLQVPPPQPSPPRSLRIAQ